MCQHCRQPSVRSGSQHYIQKVAQMFIRFNLWRAMMFGKVIFLFKFFMAKVQHSAAQNPLRNISHCNVLIWKLLFFILMAPWNQNCVILAKQRKTLVWMSVWSRNDLRELMFCEMSRQNSQKSSHEPKRNGCCVDDHVVLCHLFGNVGSLRNNVILETVCFVCLLVSIAVTAAVLHWPD